MDKSFNDEELSDIMKEIEALEEDFKSDDLKNASPVLEDLANLDEDLSIPFPNSNILPLGSKRNSPKANQGATPATSMSFKVQGDLTLNLQFEIGAKSVVLQVTEEGLTIEMDGGVKFTVPVSETTSLKKAV